MRTFRSHVVLFFEFILFRLKTLGLTNERTPTQAVSFYFETSPRGYFETSPRGRDFTGVKVTSPESAEKDYHSAIIALLQGADWHLTMFVLTASQNGFFLTLIFSNFFLTFRKYVSENFKSIPTNLRIYQ